MVKWPCSGILHRRSRSSSTPEPVQIVRTGGNHLITGGNHLTIPPRMVLPALSLHEDVPYDIDTDLVRLIFPELPRSEDWSSHASVARQSLEYVRRLDREAGGFRSHRQ